MLFKIILLHFMVRFFGFTFPVFPLKSKNLTVLHVFTSFVLQVRVILLDSLTWFHKYFKESLSVTEVTKWSSHSIFQTNTGYSVVFFCNAAQGKNSEMRMFLGTPCLPAEMTPIGFAKNQAVIQSSGTYLCFLDSDDVMMPQRVRLQHEVAIQHPNSIVGCQVRREPLDSTERYTRWINNLTQEQLLTQVFTSHGPTVVMPTWFCSREWFFHVGRFDEGGKGVPEDLLFFYEHLQKGGEVFRVNHCLLLYRYHPQAATHSVLEETIWNHRVRFLEDRVLSSWTSFTIWNAGKQGKKLYRSLSPANQKKVSAFCDVDEKKITKGFYTYEESEERPKPKIPVCHFRDASPPFVICVKLDLTGGAFETNLDMLNLKEGMDYYHFN
uniref:UDP-GlcNAc:betaGal beta-1,3-N-acetylglucosaminyltransferase like 1 n=1 Tax=Corvus moneduloides TaxID=1196302 RepID=A0A8C3ENZ8_CORMO